MKAFNAILESILNWAFYLSLAFFVLTISWNMGWNIIGDPYSLGPYLSWLSVVFPLSALGVWGVFFSAWTLGALRKIHLSRWGYLLFISALLMLNVLLSVNPESSLAYLSFFLTGFLWLSISFTRVMNNRYFWGWYVFCIGLNLVLWYLVPNLVNPLILGLTIWLGALHAWVQTQSGKWRTLLSLGTLYVTLVLPLSLSVDLLVLLSWFWLWALEYQNYRRKNLKSYLVVIATLALFFGWSYAGQNWIWSWAIIEVLAPYYNLLTGVGIGQLEWAQYQSQTQFLDPQSVTTQLWGIRRWWYELGLLMVLWLPALWLLCVGAAQQFAFRTLLFWGIVLLVPQIWQSPAGILLVSFWWFNRDAWEVGSLPPVKQNPKLPSTA